MFRNKKAFCFTNGLLFKSLLFSNIHVSTVVVYHLCFCGLLFVLAVVAYCVFCGLLFLLSVVAHHLCFCDFLFVLVVMAYRICAVPCGKMCNSHQPILLCNNRN